MRLFSSENILGRAIAATDDDIGKCTDLLIDDRNWAIRYLVVDTGHWLPGRKVVLSPAELARNGPLAAEGHVRTRLTRNQVKSSPSLERHAPVSRQLEKQLAAYYGWPAYWEGGGLWGATAMPAAEPVNPAYPGKLPEDLAETAERHNHLHSVRELKHYVHHARDGDLGVLRELLFEADSWRTRFIVLKTSRWFGSSTRAFPANWISRIDTVGRAVHTDHTREAIRDCPEISADHAGDPEVTDTLLRHFGDDT